MNEWTSQFADTPANTLDAARQAIQAQYARSGQAWKSKDSSTLMNMVTPDFSQRMPDGTTIYHEQIEPAMKEWFASIKGVTDYVVVVNDMTLQGSDVVALVSENVATTFADPTGKKHDALQSNTSRVTWTQTTEGWRIRHTEYLTWKMLVDGLPVSA